MILNLTRNINGFQILAKSEPNYWIGKKITLEAKRINTLSLGVIGLGRIGGSLLRKYKSLSNNTFFYDPYQPSGIEKIFKLIDVRIYLNFWRIVILFLLTPL